MLQQHVAAIKKSSSEYGKVLEWLKRHAWKACNRQNRFGVRIPSFRFYIYNKVYEEKYSYCTFCNIGFTWMCSLPMMAQEESMGFHQALKTKFIEGNAGFMSLVAIALIVGMAFCIERIIYLSLLKSTPRS